MNTLARKLIAKDFYLYRWLIVGSTVAGLVGLRSPPKARSRFNIGMLIWLTTIVAFGVVLAMLAIANERKERAAVRAEPAAVPRRLHTHQGLGLLLCFLVPWCRTERRRRRSCVMPNLPDGLLPFAVLLCVFMLANYSVVLCGALHTASEGS
jgi:uncharacterized membrane protein YidH (DUF202 family)